ncbi:bifunctional diguanylate cyclase/phosphodiesterase [uncultured Cellulomonas sp.]|uniref:putative bifunctional diguanylate cyclase/phosphodiesterase n=1 Tax=uncultured Cellulomonas sp. TaxID=189682 RepID=UPI00260E4627|nr:EAL domain-containing protein [uncultured Cellulomonas sp.]
MDIRRHVEPRDAVVAARTAGALVVIGAAVTAVVAVVGRVGGGTGGGRGGVATIALPVLLLVTGLVLLSRWGPRSWLLLALAPLVGLGAIAAMDLGTHDATAAGHIFFCYPVLYAASHLRTGAAAVVTAAAVAADAVVAFHVSPPDRALTDVLYMTTTLVVIAVILVGKGRRHDVIVHELRRGERALTRQATHDALTGLPNRVLFHERLRCALAGGGRPGPATRPPAPADGPGRPQCPAPGPDPTHDRRASRRSSGVAVLFCDLDGFKAVNDSLGHRAGDELLRVVAQRLRDGVRDVDLVARLGGDEFAVLLRDVDQDAARAVADRVLAAVADAVPVAGEHVHVGISIGIALGSCGVGADVDALIREADVAMYEAKAAGRGRHVLFTPQMLAAQVEQASLVQDLHGAVSRGELFVEYQPVVDLGTGLADGIEALARWAHPRRGLVPPATFIPLAEKAGLAGEVGAFVLATAQRDARAFAASAGRQVSIGVNVSARQLADGGILEHIEAGRTEALQLLVEVTETTLLRADVIPVLEELRRRDVRVAMDDFGVGRSSIAALRLMPVDAIKLDRAFTVDVSWDPRAAAVVRAVSTMARELELSLVAEGIETVEQHEALTGLGCRLGQGYLLARPMGAPALCDYLTAAAAAGAPVADRRRDDVRQVGSSLRLRTERAAPSVLG